MNAFDRIAALPSGTEIPKPDASEPFTIKGLGIRRGEEAIIYRVPNREDPRFPHEKGITRTELMKAIRHLAETGNFDRQWFNVNLHACAKEGDCNFTTIGGFFELLGVAHHEVGIYVRRRTATQRVAPP